MPFDAGAPGKAFDGGGSRGEATGAGREQGRRRSRNGFSCFALRLWRLPRLDGRMADAELDATLLRELDAPPDER